MEHKKIKPVAAFSIENGKSAPLEGGWPDLTRASGHDGPGGYKWLHFDLNDEASPMWVEEHLPEIAARALLRRKTRPRFERHTGGFLLDLRGIDPNPDADPEDMVSLRMWVTPDSVVSTQTGEMHALDAIRAAAKAGHALPTVGRFLVGLADGLTHQIETELLELVDETDEIEEAVTENRDLPHGQLVNLRQTVIKMRRFINPQRDALSELAAMEDGIVAEDELSLLREAGNRTRRIVEELDATRDRLSAIQDHLDAEQVLALSRNSYVLSVVAAIFLPLTFLTGLFGVNIAGMPGMHEPWAFWLLTGASVICGIVLFLGFKLAKWL